MWVSEYWDHMLPEFWRNLWRNQYALAPWSTLQTQLHRMLRRTHWKRRHNSRLGVPKLQIFFKTSSLGDWVVILASTASKQICASLCKPIIKSNQKIKLAVDSSWVTNQFEFLKIRQFLSDLSKKNFFLRTSLKRPLENWFLGDDKSLKSWPIWEIPIDLWPRNYIQQVYFVF